MKSMKISVSEAYKTMFTEYPDVLSVPQAVKILGCTDHTIYKMIDYGYFPAVRYGKRYRISKYGLIQYLLEENKLPKGENDND